MKNSEVRWMEATTSTNTAVADIAQREKLKNLVLVADHQTDGRGQFGRKWLSEPGENLLFSIYFEPELKPADAPQITQIAAQAVVKVLTHYGIPCAIKLPNDVLVNGKKICGILTESSSQGEKLLYVVVGIGLNVNSPAEHLLPEALSMAVVTGRKHDRREILEKILTEFQPWLTPGVEIQNTRS